jgi:predicted component of type VI protein secretion system
MSTTHETTCDCVTIDGVTIVIIAGCTKHDPRRQTKTYRVTVTVTGFQYIDVDATSEEEAIRIAQDGEDWEYIGETFLPDDDFEAEEL